MTKKFKSINVGQRFKYGGVRFKKTRPKTIDGPRRVNAVLYTTGAITHVRHFYFVADDEVTVCVL